jgi:hypothetical protein
MYDCSHQVFKLIQANQIILRPLPPGRVHSEPGVVNHFARTTDTLVVLHINDYGPTETRYFSPAPNPAESTLPQ